MSNETKDKDNGKKYTQEEFNKALVDALVEAKKTHFSFTISRTWALPDYGKLLPELNVKLSGGSPQQLDVLAIKVQELLLQFQQG